MRSLRAWLALPSPSRWLIRTIRLGNAIQFARRPPKFRGVHFTSVKAVDTHVLRAEIAVLLAKGAIELVPPADMRSGFYSPYFIVPKKSGGLRPILDLRVLNRSLHKLPFKMQTFSPWSDPLFLRAGVALEQVSRHAVVFTDASATGWGATYNGQAVSEVWTGPQRHWHINCLELLAVYLALGRLKGPLRGKHVLVRTDNTATVAYINHQGGLRSRRMSQLARHLLLWLRAIHIPGVLNRVADELSRAALPGEWRLHPQVVQLIWGEFGEAQVDLFASLGTSHCQLFYSLSGGTLGTDALVHSWPRGLRKYAFPPVNLLAQTLCKVREDEERVLLVAPYWPNRTWFLELMLLATAPPWLVPLRKDLLSQRRGTLWHPLPDLWKLHVWSLDGTRRY